MRNTESPYYLALSYAPTIGVHPHLLNCLKYFLLLKIYLIWAKELTGLGMKEALIDYLHNPDWKTVEQELSWQEQPQQHILTWQDETYPRTITWNSRRTTHYLYQRPDRNFTDTLTCHHRRPPPDCRRRQTSPSIRQTPCRQRLNDHQRISLRNRRRRPSRRFSRQRINHSRTRQWTWIHLPRPSSSTCRTNQQARRDHLRISTKHQTPARKFPTPQPHHQRPKLRRARSRSRITKRLPDNRKIRAGTKPGNIRHTRFHSQPVSQRLPRLNKTRRKTSRNQHRHPGRTTLFNAVPPPRQNNYSAPLDLPPLDAHYKKLVECISFETTPMDVIIHRSGLTAETASSMVLMLELQGYIQAVNGGYTRNWHKRESPTIGITS